MKIIKCFIGSYDMDAIFIRMAWLKDAREEIEDDI